MSSLQATTISVFLCHWWWLNEYAMLYVWMSEYYNTATVLFAATLSLVKVLFSIEEYLKFLDSNIYSLIDSGVIEAHPHFNVITHFLAQCGSEPWSTTITASAPTCTPFRAPQRISQVLLEFSCFSVLWLTKILRQMEVQVYQDKGWHMMHMSQTDLKHIICPVLSD